MHVKLLSKYLELALGVELAEHHLPLGMRRHLAEQLEVMQATLGQQRLGRLQQRKGVVQLLLEEIDGREVARHVPDSLLADVDPERLEQVLLGLLRLVLTEDAHACVVVEDTTLLVAVVRHRRVDRMVKVLLSQFVLASEPVQNTEFVVQLTS